MSCSGKWLASVLILILAFSSPSLLIVKPANAQSNPTPSVPTPSVPTFTLQVQSEKGTVPTTYQLNSSSGQIVATLGYHWEKTNVYVIINNQPLAHEYNGGSLNLWFLYDIRIKESGLSNSWTDLDNLNNGGLEPSPGEYTNASIGDSYGNATLDVQIEAVIGSFSYGNNGYSSFTSFAVWQTSGWSATQSTVSSENVVTLTAPHSPASQQSSAPQTSNPTTTSIATSSASITLLQITNTIALIVIAILLAIIIVLLLLMRHRKTANLKQSLSQAS